MRPSLFSLIQDIDQLRREFAEAHRHRPFADLPEIKCGIDQTDGGDRLRFFISSYYATGIVPFSDYNYSARQTFDAAVTQLRRSIIESNNRAEKSLAANRELLSRLGDQ
jgi:hypothetical protein